MCVLSGTTSLLSSLNSAHNSLTIYHLTSELMEYGNLGVHGFEAASLGNLMPATADEAKSLIASLKRFDDADITALCNIVQR